MKTLKILGLFSIFALIMLVNISIGFAAPIEEKMDNTSPTLFVSEPEPTFPGDEDTDNEGNITNKSGTEDADIPVVDGAKVIKVPENSVDASIVIPLLTPDEEETIIRSVISEADETRLAKMVYGEDRQNNLMMRSATIWCVFNRLDNKEFAKSIRKIVTHGAFHGYSYGQNHPQWAHDLVRDVALRYALEKAGYMNVGRVLPQEYDYFASKNGKNRFRTEYHGSHGIWDWSLPDPYEGAYSFDELEENPGNE